MKRAIGTARAAAFVLLTAAAALPAVSGSAAVADDAPAAGVLYVSGDPTLGVPCSDAGNGAEDRPFCTISAAAAVVLPGQTVMVEPGTYNESVHITRSGTASAPVTFVASTQALQVSVGALGRTAVTDVFSVSGAQNVVIRGFRAFPGTSGAGIRVTDSSNITFDQGAVEEQTGGTGATVTGTSHDVTISRTSFVGGRSTGVQIDPGATGTVVSGDNFFDYVDSMSAVQAADAPGTVVTNNSVLTRCSPGISLAGASSGSSIENNIVETANVALDSSSPTACAAPTTGISVSAGSAPGTTADYNLIDPVGGAPYSWAGNSYGDLSSFSSATAQGAHDLAAAPGLTCVWHGNFPTCPPAVTSPAVDSGDAAAPGAPDRDFAGNPREDDPSVGNSGTGAGYYDRGAVELLGGWLPDGPEFTVQPQGPAHPLTVTLTAQAQTSSWTHNLPLTRTTWWKPDDSPFPFSTTATSISYTFHRAGYHKVDDGSNSIHVVVGADYNPVPPQRILDTRSAVGVSSSGPVAPGADLVLPLGTLGGVQPADISAVVANVTVTQPTAAGSLTVYGDGDGLPASSNLNFTEGQTVANLVTVQQSNGSIRFHNRSSGTVHIVADLQGYYSGSGYGFKPSDPTRVLDTRTGPQALAGDQPLGARKSLVLDLSGKVPAGAAAAVLNVTATQPTAAGFITAYPHSQPVPTASDLDFTAGQTVPNLVVVPLVDGKADLYNGSPGSVHLIADLEGFYGTSASGATATYVPYGPARIADTRTTGPDGRPGGAVPAGGTLTVDPLRYDECGGQCPLPASQLLNITVTAPTKSGVLTAYPDGGKLPGASNVNFTAGQTVPNLASVPENAPPHSPIHIYNHSSGTVQIVLDEDGYFIQPQGWSNY